MIRGDGIGPEVVDACSTVLHNAASAASLKLEFVDAPAGDETGRLKGKALPESTIETIAHSDACLKGPVGKSAADVIVRLRQELDLYANVRPAKSLPGVRCLDAGVDMVIVRENTEDLYKGLEIEFDGGVLALRSITAKASERISRFAFELSRSRAGKKSVVCVHKNNVLKKSDGLFVGTFYKIAGEFQDVKAEDMLVDSAAMNFIRKPSEFDVVVTTNLYGDILSDETAQVVGGLGLTPSANIGEKYAIFEPVHGSAPDIAGTGTANPTAIILSASMMLDWLSRSRKDSDCLRASEMIRKAVHRTLADGVKTRDLGGSTGTSDFAAAVSSRLEIQS